MPPSPTILVKRADGTTVRMTLDEVKKLQAKKGVPNAQPTVTNLQAGEPVTFDASKLTNVGAAELPGAPPRPRVVLPLVIKKKSDSTKEPSVVLITAKPIEERPKIAVQPKEVLRPVPTRPSANVLEAAAPPDHEIRHPALVGMSQTDAAVDKVLVAARLAIPPELQGRARSLVRSAVKGVRDEEQFNELALRAPAAGGLGWTPERAQAVWSLAAKERAVPPALPVVSSAARALATTTPVRDIFVDEARAVSLGRGRLPGRDTLKAGGAGEDRSALGKERQSRAAVLHDIEPPAQATNGTPVIMGPVEEMKTFGLKDWRRLGAKPDSAREALVAKFQGWKDESFLLYLEAREAWRASPLMRQYRELVASAINRGRSLRETVSGQPPKDNLGEADVVALIDVNKQLAV